MTKPELEKKVLDKIEELESELVKVALEVAEKPSFQPNEKIAGDYVYDWFKANGLEPKKVGAPERFNVLAKYAGTGRGRSLVFCSHLDSGREERLDTLDPRDEEALKLWTSAWREGETLVGNGIGNDRGSMACWMMATKAIKDCNIKLPGSILLASVVGETGGAPIDEFPSPKYDSHELGARYAATHGALADFALVAESTDFTICPLECGFAYFKVTIYAGPSKYTPFFPYPEKSMNKSVSPIFRMAKFIERYNDYAVDYMRKNTFSFEGSLVVPKTSLGAARTGMPHYPAATPEWASMYFDFRIPPGKDPLESQRDLEGLLAELGMDGKVEMFKFLPGYEATKVKGYDVFRKAIVDAHLKVFDQPIKKAVSATSNMWRDSNSFNELGVPSVSYGFPSGYSSDDAKELSIRLYRVKIKDMVSATKVYALLALDLCSQPA